MSGEQTYKTKGAPDAPVVRSIVPIEDAEIINSCGYIFKGSTNMMEYIEDFHNQSTLQQSF